jgi:SNF2 family DNA or RNA helicase
MRNLPLKAEIKVQCPLSALQLQAYRDILVHGGISLSGDGDERSEGNWQGLQFVLIQLQKLCNHP